MAAMFEAPFETQAEPQAVLNGLPDPRFFTVEEYQRLAEIGILSETESSSFTC